MIKVVPEVKEITCDGCGHVLGIAGADLPKFNPREKLTSITGKYTVGLCVTAHRDLTGTNPYYAKSGPADLCRKCVSDLLEALLAELKLWEAGKAATEAWLKEAEDVPNNIQRCPQQYPKPKRPYSCSARTYGN